MADAVIFGLRMNAGIDLAKIAQRFPAPEVLSVIEPLFARFEAEGLLFREGTRAWLTHQGRLVCDAIGSAVLQAVV
jgi:oxygen-independent coproporphyrinogen-3 oxidase